jgi:hypothetical protein
MTATASTTGEVATGPHFPSQPHCPAGRIIQAWPSPGKGRPATGSTNATHPSQMRDTAAGRAFTGPTSGVLSHEAHPSRPSQFVLSAAARKPDEAGRGYG